MTTKCQYPNCDRPAHHVGRCLTLYRADGSRASSPPAAAHAAGIEASDVAGDHKWTMLERVAVDRAIEAVAIERYTFTADEVWAKLGPDFPVTKGMAGRLMSAGRRGVIAPTGEVTFSQRTGAHGHGQRLAIWRSLR